MRQITRLSISFMSLVPFVLLAPLLSAFSACDGRQADEKVVEQVKVEEAKEENEEKPGKTLSLDDTAQPKLEKGISAPPVAGSGPQLRDPSWFRPTLFAGATVLSKGRAAADENGLFSSQITLQLSEGTTIDACVMQLIDAVQGDVPELKTVDKGDRRSITGSNSMYSVVMLCGEAKGRMTAYISYTWTSPPPA
ncbi:MAG TPA: hypothetical protein ENK31_08505 [Nannocystis exedens]|nr:hypothetical protein [Nannocystis exedens]